ncbi:family 43 glycosylhydrolase [Sphingomonas albertensis]|uniref:Family 43 glycosylhydrolase n=1 Tax=Sphingomonas albertensis TaxID=2762591 RepID=A0ABR7AIE9_9SPHN|nr:family 43 glycosylhydrolase [Sphingomonas albertensis]MBC3940233.1 family 43 glycosylhydrolase [Sphingomonas albertensis]
MKRLVTGALGLCTILAVGIVPARAQLQGETFIHDPSTVTLSEGRYYTFGTRGGGLVSEDGWTWHGGPERPGGGVAPDVIKIGDRYYMAYAVGGGGMGGGHASQVKMMWTYSLDPKSPKFKFHDIGVVASSDGVETADAFDPAFLYVDGRLWLTYGTYFGPIRIIELDPKTGLRLAGNQPVDVAIDMEATAMMHRDGYYYLLGTHGTCCDGPNSTYHIRVGRSRSPLGPYVDHMGTPLLRGGGKLVISARGRNMGPGHFGLIELGNGVEKFSMHYEADMDRSGRSVLGIAPLRWTDGWPVAGENVAPGMYEIASERSGYALQLATDVVRIAFDARRSFMAKPSDPVAPIADQTLAEESIGWPQGSIRVDLGDYMNRPRQRWTIAPVPGAGGYFGAPFYSIVIAGTDRALAANAAGEVETVATFTGASEQLWQIDQLTDGTYRIAPKAAPGRKPGLALVAIGASTPTLAPFDPVSPAGRWTFRQP